MGEELLNEAGELNKVLLSEIQEYKNDTCKIHPYDISEQLLELRDLDFEQYSKIVKKIPSELFAEVLSEMPEHIQEELGELLSIKKIANIASMMDTDDAADFIQILSEDNEGIAQSILETFDTEDKEIIEALIAYKEDEAGSYMQAELFSARKDEKIGTAIKRLKELKDINEVDNIFHCYIIDENNTFLGSVGLEELIIFDHDMSFHDIPEDKFKNYKTDHKSDVKDVVNMVTNYNLTAIPVVDHNDKLIGRITSDDIYDIIEESATEQIYNMAGVNDEAEQEEDLYTIGKSRAFWLGINLITAIAASVVIGFFDTTIQSIVALAVLMPIVASMGGNAGTQTLTVTVRQMALGEIERSDAKRTIYKEIMLSLVNGLLFAVVIGFIAYAWFSIPLLGLVIALSMIVNLLSAGFFGAVIPLVLQKADIDPAIGSTVLLTTVTDIVGFFSFLGLATLILL